MTITYLFQLKLWFYWFHPSPTPHLMQQALAVSHPHKRDMEKMMETNYVLGLVPWNS